jgi:hypothetical protein
VKKAPLFILLPVLVLTGCFGLSTKSDFDRSIDFTQYRTFGFIEDLADDQGGKIGDDVIVGHIKNSIEKELTAKGMEKVAADDADMLVAYHVIHRNRVAIDTYGYRYDPWSYVDVNRYIAGMAVIDLVDNESRETVWRGIANDVVSENKERDSDPERIDYIINKILKKYPPKK